jgi:protein SCO1
MTDEERKNQENEEELEGHVPAEREASLLNLRTLLIAVAGLIGMILFIQLVAGAIFVYFRATELPDRPGLPAVRDTLPPPPGPGLQVEPDDDLRRVRATEQARLQGYGWVDRDAGLVHIPIERAMEILAEHGLPVAEEGREARERIDARESGFLHPTGIPPVTPGPEGTPLLEITLPPETPESTTLEPDEGETGPLEAATQTPDVSGTPEAFAPMIAVSHGNEGPGDPLAPIETAGYEQRLDQAVPLDTALVDEQGRTVRLGDFFGDKPVILVFAYYECPMLCTLVLNDLTRAMGSIDLDIGDEFEVVTVSIDPRETPELAYAKKSTYLKEYNRSGAEQGWHFLTGNETAIQALTEAAGFRYFYDEELDQYAHPAGILILTPAGRIARYLAGIDFPAKDLRLGLVEASTGKIGSAIDQFFLLCYAYDPVHGRYNLVIENVLKIAGLATVLLLGSTVSIFLWKERRRERSRLEPQD